MRNIWSSANQSFKRFMRTYADLQRSGIEDASALIHPAGIRVRVTEFADLRRRHAAFSVRYRIIG